MQACQTLNSSYSDFFLLLLSVFATYLVEELVKENENLFCLVFN